MKREFFKLFYLYLRKALLINNMHLQRKNNKAVANSHKSFSDIGDYIRMIVDIYSSSEIDRQYWLTEREKEFYVATVVHVLNGHLTPISDESIQIYKKYFGNSTNKPKISDYLNRCKRKNWLKYDKIKKEVEIPPIFMSISVDGDIMDFNLRYVYETKETETDRPFVGTGLRY